MQVLEVPTSIHPKEHTIETFLISTKPFKTRDGLGNIVESRISKQTGHEQVKKTLGRDFSIIPELLFRPLEQAGGGHVFGPKDYVYKQYQDNSHGKIVELRGPIYYNDGTDDYKYNAIVKLDNSRSASVLQEHGSNTWVPFAVSPHYFMDESGGGSDKDGWNVWDLASLTLVIKGAYGNEAVVSKLCNGPHKACKMELLQRKASTEYPLPEGIGVDVYWGGTDKFAADLITSLVQRTGSTNSLIMADTKLSTEPEQPQPPNNGEGEGNGQEEQQKMKIFKDTEVIKAPTPEQINISAEELNQLRETQKQFKEMQNERRDELLKEIFANVEDENARKELIKEYSKNDLIATKSLKAFYDKVSPHISNATKKAIELELQQKKEEENKKNKVNSNGRSASTVQLRAEPKVEKEEEQRAASSSKVDEVALLKKFMSNNGGYS